MFEEIDLPALGPLPRHSYTCTEIKTVKVNIDYHVEYGKKLYSVPYIYRGKRVEVHASENIVAIYFRAFKFETQQVDQCRRIPDSEF